MNKFKEGDKIRMIQGCGEQEKGEILTVREIPTEPTRLFVRHKDNEYSTGNLCVCQHKWELVEDATWRNTI